MGGIIEHSFNCAGVDNSAMSIKDFLPLLELCVVPCTTCVKENSCMRLVSIPLYTRHTCTHFCL